MNTEFLYYSVPLLSSILILKKSILFYNDIPIFLKHLVMVDLSMKKHFFPVCDFPFRTMTKKNFVMSRKYCIHKISVPCNKTVLCNFAIER